MYCSNVEVSLMIFKQDNESIKCVYFIKLNMYIEYNSCFLVVLNMNFIFNLIFNGVVIIYMVNWIF